MGLIAVLIFALKSEYVISNKWTTAVVNNTLLETDDRILSLVTTTPSALKSNEDEVCWARD